MKRPIVHGCYDQATYSTLLSLDVETVAFDLRPTSLNLVTFPVLKEILSGAKSKNFILIFENDTLETVNSYLDLLKGTFKNFLLEFRGNQEVDFYTKLDQNFIWFFSPGPDWESIIKLSRCEGIVLPLKYQDLYHHMPLMWSMVEELGLMVWLHAETMDEIKFFEGKADIFPSLDLPRELKSDGRTMNQEKLKQIDFWSSR